MKKPQTFQLSLRFLLLVAKQSNCCSVLETPVKFLHNTFVETGIEAQDGDTSTWEAEQEVKFLRPSSSSIYRVWDQPVIHEILSPKIGPHPKKRKGKKKICRKNVDEKNWRLNREEITKYKNNFKIFNLALFYFWGHVALAGLELSK